MQASIIVLLVILTVPVKRHKMHLILQSFLAFRWSLYLLQGLCCYRCRICAASFKVVDTQASSESFGSQLLIALAKSFLWPRIISKFAMSDSVYEHESLAGVEIFALRWFPLSLSLNNCCNTRFWSQNNVVIIKITMKNYRVNTYTCCLLLLLLA